MRTVLPTPAPPKADLAALSVGGRAGSIPDARSRRPRLVDCSRKKNNKQRRRGGWIGARLFARTGGRRRNGSPIHVKERPRTPGPGHNAGAPPRCSGCRGRTSANKAVVGFVFQARSRGTVLSPSAVPHLERQEFSLAFETPGLETSGREDLRHCVRNSTSRRSDDLDGPCEPAV